MTLLNIHESVQFKSGGVRFLGTFKLPSYNYAAAFGSDDAVSKWQLRLYHTCMSIVSEELRKFCLQPCKLRLWDCVLFDMVPLLAFMGSDFEQIRQHLNLVNN